MPEDSRMLFFGNMTADGIDDPTGRTMMTQSRAMTALSDGRTTPDDPAAAQRHWLCLAHVMTNCNFAARENPTDERCAEFAIGTTRARPTSGRLLAAMGHGHAAGHRGRGGLCPACAQDLAGLAGPDRPQRGRRRRDGTGQVPRGRRPEEHSGNHHGVVQEPQRAQGGAGGSRPSGRLRPALRLAHR